MKKYSKIFTIILINSLMTGLLITGFNAQVSNFYTFDFHKSIKSFILLEKTMVFLISIYLLYFATIGNYYKTKKLKTFTNIKSKNEFKTQHTKYANKLLIAFIYSSSTIVFGHLLSKLFTVPSIFDNIILPINYLSISTYGLLKMLMELAYFAMDVYATYLLFKENIYANLTWSIGEKVILNREKRKKLTKLDVNGRYLEFDLLLYEIEKYFEDKAFRQEKFQAILDQLQNTIEQVEPLEQISVYSFLKLLKTLEELELTDDGKSLDIEKISETLEYIEDILENLTEENEEYKKLYMLFNLELSAHSEELEKLETTIKKIFLNRLIDKDVVEDKWLIIREIILSAIFYNLIYAYEDEERFDTVVFLMDILYRYLYRPTNYELVHIENYPYLYIHTLLGAYNERFKGIATNLKNYAKAYEELKVFSQIYHTLLEVLISGGVI